MNEDKNIKTTVSYSSKHSAELNDYHIPDIDGDEVFYGMFLKSRPHTMTGKESLYALYKAVQYVILRNLEGAFVECGVWKGGSSLLAALAFRHFGRSERELWLYDTFEGMSQPTDIDVDVSGVSARQYISDYSDRGKWCYAGIDSVEALFKKFDFLSNARLIPGDVLETLKQYRPEKISILRLDTDWYESTKFELEQLYERLVPNGVLIIDDYGHWKGSRLAVDEFFVNHPNIYLHRVDPAVRLAIKS